MADALVAAIGSGVPPSEPPAPRVELGLVMSDGALFGESDEPAHLDTFGPVPAELAREVVAGTLSRGEELWLRRLYAHPATGELVAMDARARRFRGGLPRLVRLRDQTCRTPWCDAPVRHTDHVRAAAQGGETTRDNAQALCEACNYAKDAAEWRARAGPDGSVETTTPTGHRYLSRPPVVTRVIRRDLPRIEIDLVIAS